MMIPRNSKRDSISSSTDNAVNRLQMDRYTEANNNKNKNTASSDLNKFSSHFPNGFSIDEFDSAQFPSDFTDNGFPGESDLFNSSSSVPSGRKSSNNGRANANRVGMSGLTQDDFSLSGLADDFPQNLSSNQPSALSSSNSRFSPNMATMDQLSGVNRIVNSAMNSGLSNIPTLDNLGKLTDSSGGLEDSSSMNMLGSTDSNLDFATQSLQWESLRPQRRQQSQSQQRGLNAQNHSSKSNQYNTYPNKNKRTFDQLSASDIDLHVTNDFIRQQIQSQSRPGTSKSANNKVNENKNNNKIIDPIDDLSQTVRNFSKAQQQALSQALRQSQSKSRGSVMDNDQSVSLADSMLFLSPSGNVASDMDSLLSNPVLDSTGSNDSSQQLQDSNPALIGNRSDSASNSLLNPRTGSIQDDTSNIWGIYDGDLGVGNDMPNNLTSPRNSMKNSSEALSDSSGRNDFQENMSNSRNHTSKMFNHSGFSIDPSSPFVGLGNEDSQSKQLAGNIPNDQSLLKNRQSRILNQGGSNGTTKLQLFEAANQSNDKGKGHTQNTRGFNNQTNQLQSLNKPGHINLGGLSKQSNHEQNQNQNKLFSKHQDQLDAFHKRNVYNQTNMHQNRSINVHKHISSPNNNTSPSNTPDYIQQNPSSHHQSQTAHGSGNNSGSVSQMISPQPLISPSYEHSHHHNMVPGTLNGHPNSYFPPPIAPHEAELMIIRQKYKAKSSIPPDMNLNNYAQQCIYAARSSRLSPFSLHTGEYNFLRHYLPVVHVTTYLNIRNGILRLWLSNPKVNVTRSEAAGCAKDDRFFNLAEVAYDWLVRNGYINFGCFEYPSLDYYNPILEERRKPRQTVVILGAGIAGLSCARQLDNLFQRKARHFAEYQDLPRIVILEGRRRIGGRVYSARLKSSHENAVDLGAQFIMGFGNGNPLAVVCRRQLGLPVTKIESGQDSHDNHTKTNDSHKHFNSISSNTKTGLQGIIYDSQTGQPVSSDIYQRAHALFQHLLERVSQFRNSIPPPMTVHGDKVLVNYCKDPTSEEFPGILTIAKAEDTGRLKSKNMSDESDFKDNNSHSHGHHHHGHGYGHNDYQKEDLGKIEAQFLKDIGYQLKPGVSENASIRLIPEPQGDMYPSLGVSMDALLRQLQEIAYIVSDDLRVVNWYYANLEYSSATCLDNLSLTNWMHGNCEKGYEESDASESEDESKADHHTDVHSASPTNSRKQASHNSSDFTGAPSIIKNGYINLARGLYLYPEKLNVRFKSNVKIVEYSKSRNSNAQSSTSSSISGMSVNGNEGGTVEVILESGEKVKADKVVVTAPLGVLKDRAIQFIPDLPQWKQDSIERLGFGVVNKVCLIFKKAFWDLNQTVFSIAQPFELSPDGDGAQYRNNFNYDESLDQSQYRLSRGVFYTFWNASKAVGKPCLIGIISGEAAVHLANEPDDYIVDEAKKTLASIIPAAQNGELVESIVTRWQVDPFSRGSYSYIGLEATTADYDLLARPIGESLFFAGEATERKYPATVHGAYLSGLRAASEVLTSMIGEIKIPLPLVPSKSYQLNKRMQQSVNDSGVLGVPSSVVQAVASGIGTPVSMHGIGSTSASASGSHHVTPPSSMVHTPNNMVDTYTGMNHHGNDGAVYSGNAHGHIPSHLNHVSSISTSSPPKGSGFKHKQSQEENPTESRLRALRDERLQSDNERMRADMIKELGKRPIKPERSGANPFLIFQKDFWEKCRQQCDIEKQKSTGDAHARAARNEVRAALGKMWREFPEKDKEPYLIKTKDIKEVNLKKNEEYKEQVRRYETEADDFKKRWKEQYATKPSEEESQLMKYLQEERLQEKKQLKQQQMMNSTSDKYKGHEGSYGGSSHNSYGAHGYSHLRSSFSNNSGSYSSGTKGSSGSAMSNSQQGDYLSHNLNSGDNSSKGSGGKPGGPKAGGTNHSPNSISSTGEAHVGDTQEKHNI